MRTLASERGVSEPIENKIVSIQQGDEQIRYQLLKDYQPLVKKIVSNVCNYYIDETMDEFSIGLSAFNDAINQYKSMKNIRFVTFAHIVIRRKVIDFIRKESRHRQIIFMEENIDNQDNLEESLPQLQKAVRQYELNCQSEDILCEINELKKLLTEYGISLKCVQKQCPKKIDSRRRIKNIANTIAENADLVHYLKLKKKLPMKQLLNTIPYSRKTVQRFKCYIIAIVLISTGSFTRLKSYI
ncbi:RNA polymerase sigma factor SigI [Pullulanibacillus camelliae]|uniref:RNA polymerase sigma factor SigI n=1 Tax=Pullulanibacillus camelliae TaxID=1707096 RepID=A0A8J2YBF2_9BACL|nr:RNA polymerase sigma-I factor [Pullulanibacillus camelliae]GGE32910.1 RNA polymerase sigma factor SigI [Pullulanibacillus camelliae]